jgi:hypothetical protein
MSQPLLSRVWSCASLGLGQTHLMAVKQEGLSMQQKMQLELQAGYETNLVSK